MYSQFLLPVVITVKSIRVIRKLRAGETHVTNYTTDNGHELKKLDPDMAYGPRDRNYGPQFGVPKPVSPSILPNINRKNPYQYSNEEINRLLCTPTCQLTKDDRLIQSVVTDVVGKRDKPLTPAEAYALMRQKENLSKYKLYRFWKRAIPIWMTGTFTGAELTKFSYAAAIGSTSVPITIPGYIGLALPSFFMWHMLSFYVPDKFKGPCRVLKYSMGLPYLIMAVTSDTVFEKAETAIFNEPLPDDLIGFGGSIPANLDDLQTLVELFEPNKMKASIAELMKKSYD